MPRNLYERVEVMFPLKDALGRERVRHEILDAYLVDNVKSRVLRKDGVYVRTWQAEGKRKPPAGGRGLQRAGLSAGAGGRQTGGGSHAGARSLARRADSHGEGTVNRR